MAQRIKGLGEIALRVNDLNRMVDFYENIVGLEIMRREDTMAFFRIAEGFKGHTQILALFDRSSENGYVRIDAHRSTSDHFAFAIDPEDFARERQRLEDLGIVVVTRVHEWVKWRSLYFSDPEGNRIEFVCYDESVS